MFIEIASKLQAAGFDASVWQSGGNIETILLKTNAENGGRIFVWGTSCEEWGATVYRSQSHFEDGDAADEVGTDCSTEETNVDTVVSAILKAMSYEVF